MFPNKDCGYLNRRIRHCWDIDVCTVTRLSVIFTYILYPVVFDGLLVLWSLPIMSHCFNKHYLVRYLNNIWKLNKIWKRTEKSRELKVCTKHVKWKHDLSYMYGKHDISLIYKVTVVIEIAPSLLNQWWHQLLAPLQGKMNKLWYIHLTSIHCLVTFLLTFLQCINCMSLSKTLTLVVQCVSNK